MNGRGDELYPSALPAGAEAALSVFPGVGDCARVWSCGGVAEAVRVREAGV